MSTPNVSIHDVASKGGRTRAEVLTPEERSRIAREAAEARWANQSAGRREELPRATHTGKLEIGDLVLPCAVLENGMRVLSQRGMTAALGGSWGGPRSVTKQASVSGGPSPLPRYISPANLEPFIPESLRVALTKLVEYRPQHRGRTAYGVAASLLPEICDVWLKARDAGALLPQQEHIATKADILIRGFAHVGIIALVDETTGYQEERDRKELHRILEAYINKELLPWSKTFPDQYYEHLFRLRGWQYTPPSVKRPQLVGKITNDLIYKKLPRGVIEELKRRNPVSERGYRRHKHFQFLTEDIGEPHLKEQLVAVTTLMRASPSWGVFKRLMDKAFPTMEGQAEFDLGIDEGELDS